MAIVIEISIGRATTHDRTLQRGAEFCGYFFKPVLAQVVEKMRLLGILNLWLHHADVVGDVAVDCENVGQAIEIVVKKESAERERLGRDSANARNRRFIRKQPR